MARTRDKGAPAALGLTLASTVFVASYAAQRLWSAVRGDPDWTEMIVSAHTPYYWRCADALLQATGLADSGGGAKALIASGAVQVNGVVEIRRGRKLRAGDAVRLGAQQVQLQAATA